MNLVQIKQSITTAIAVPSNVQAFLAGFRAGCDANCVTRCTDCVYRWDASTVREGIEAPDHMMHCFKHHRDTAASYFCGDALKEVKTEA